MVAAITGFVFCMGFTTGTERSLAWSGMGFGSASRELKRIPTAHPKLRAPS